MTDDLVERLREEINDENGDLDRTSRWGSLIFNAANRIEELETALQDVIDSWDWWQVDTYDRCQSVPSDAIRDARKKLENKND